MGVSSTTNREVYAGDGSSVAFSFPLYFFALTDLQVYLYDTILGVITTLVSGVDYTPSGTANFQGIYPSGGTVTLNVAPASTSYLVIVRNPPQVQNFSLLQNGTISSTALTQQFDYLTLLIQRLEDQVSRCIQIPDGIGSSFSGQLPANLPVNPNSFIQINSAGNGVALSPNGGWAQKTFAYTDVQTASTTNPLALFTLPPGAMLMQVVVKHSVAFAGTSLSDVFSQVGISTDHGKFIDHFDVAQTVADGTFDSIMTNYIASWASPTVIYATFTGTGANLSNLTAGSLTVYYQYYQV